MPEGEWSAFYEMLKQHDYQAFYEALKRYQKKREEQEGRKRMTNYEADLERLEAAITAQHPCDARMYGLELCELFREALKPTVALRADASEPSRGILREGITISASDLAELMKNAPLPVPTIPGSMLVYPDGHRWDIGSKDPGASVTHVEDAHRDHWWRMSNGKWWTTLQQDYRPSGDEEAPRIWERIFTDFGSPYVINRPEKTAIKMKTSEYGEDTPPPRHVRSIALKDDMDVKFFRTRTHRDIWRAHDQSDDALKAEGYWTWQEIVEEWEGPFIEIADPIPVKFTASLKFETGVDDEPHESIPAVFTFSRTGANGWYWRYNSDKWMHHGSYAPPKDHEWKPDEFLTWDEVLAKSDRRPAEEILGAHDS